MSNQVLINEVIDIHHRSTRLYLRVNPASHELIDLEFTRTFSGSSKPGQHRVAWQTTLPREAIEALRDELDSVLREEPSNG
jgi:hypothetical protein